MFSSRCLKSGKLILLLLVFSFCVSAQGKDVVLIGHPELPQARMTSEDVKNIYLGRKTQWSDGSKVTFFVLAKSEVHDKFLSTYVAKTDSQFKTYWRRLVFTGKGKTPKIFDSEEELIEALKKTKGAIGYVAVSSKTNGLTMLKILDEKGSR